MKRMRVVIGAVLALVSAGVAAQAVPAPNPAPTPVADAGAAAEPALMLGVAQNRMTVPVSIGGQGPWPFVIDTGAERTVVSRELATSLNLAAGPPLRVVAVTGPSPAASVLVPALDVTALDVTAQAPTRHPGRTPLTTVAAPVLAARDIGAAGLLGIDTLQGHSIDIDFDRAAMTVRPSARRRVVAGMHGDEIVVVARSLFGQLIVTDARWRGRRIAVVIDTGSAITIGNPPLLAMIGTRARPLGPADAISVTGAVLQAQGYAVDDLTIGGVGFANIAVAVADAAPFRRFGLEHRPALFLGMDALRLFRHVRIDFANRDIELTLPRGQGRQPGLPGSAPGR